MVVVGLQSATDWPVNFLFSPTLDRSALRKNHLLEEWSGGDICEDVEVSESMRGQMLHTARAREQAWVNHNRHASRSHALWG